MVKLFIVSTQFRLVFDLDLAMAVITIDLILTNPLILYLYLHWMRVFIILLVTAHLLVLQGQLAEAECFNVKEKVIIRH